MESEGRDAQRYNGKKEYKVDRDFIIKGIEAGKLEFRYDSAWESPFIEFLRCQLEEYIVAELPINSFLSINFYLHLQIV